MTTTKQKAIDKARDGLKKGIYKTVRLVKIVEEKENIIIPWSKVSTIEALNRLDYIKHKLDGDLDSGTYEIQCKINFLKNGITEPFRFDVKERKIVSLSTITKTDDKEVLTEEATTMREIDLEEYIDTIKENERLKVMVEVLEGERNLYKKLYEEKGPTALNDAPEEKGMMERALEGLSGAAPILMGLAEKFMEQRDRRLSIEESKIKPTTKPTMKRRVRQAQPLQEESREQLADRLELLFESDPDLFNDELDMIEGNDPELYEYLADQLGLEDSEEEE